MDDFENRVLIAFTAETNVEMQIGDRQDWVVNMFDRPTDLEISNKACISEYALRSEDGTFFEISFFPDDYIQTMWDAEARIKEKHGEDLVFPIRHRKMGTTFTVFMNMDKAEWTDIASKSEYHEFTDMMTHVLIGTANKFINGYRLVTGDSYIRNIGLDNCHTFYFVRDEKEQLVTVANSPHRNRVVVWDDHAQKCLDELLMDEQEKDFPLDRVLVDARGLKIEGNLTVSFITLATALEIVVYDLYRNRLPGLGFEQDVIKKMLINRFSDLIKIKHLHQVFDEMEKKIFDERYLARLSETYRVRNAIVHAGKKYPEDELETHYDVLDRFIAFFAPKIPGALFNRLQVMREEAFATKEGAINELKKYWECMLDGAPDGRYVFLALLPKTAKEYISSATGKGEFPKMIAEFLGTLWPERTEGLSVYRLDDNGELQPVTDFGKLDGSWTPPDKISSALRERFRRK